jgi:hypothetical protein
MDKPDASLINQDDSLDRIIQKLKTNGRNYSNSQFLRLLQLISRNNIVDVQIPQEISSITKLLNLVDSIYETTSYPEEKQFVTLMRNALDTFDLATTETTREVRDLNNFLIKENVSMKEELIDFIQKNNGSNVTRNTVKKTLNIINNIENWSSLLSTHKEDIKISNEKIYNIIHFYKTFIENFSIIFPNIILNKVDYDDVLIPSYFKFSKNHVNKLKKSIGDYYQKLKTFYGIPIIGNLLNKIQHKCQNVISLSKTTPSFTSIKMGETNIVPIFDERTSKYLYEYYLFKIILNFIELSENKSLLVTEVSKKTDITNIFTVEYLEDEETRTDITRSDREQTSPTLVEGNMKDFRQKIAELLIVFLDIFHNQKELIDISYEEIQDRVFKLREREKNMVTDRLKQITDEERDVDTILKITKLGPYSKALQKGLTVLDKDFYDEERDFRDQMEKTEKIIRSKNGDANDSNIDILIDEYLEQEEVDLELDEEAYNMEYINEDFYNGNIDGVGAPEEEYEDYEDFN